PNVPKCPRKQRFLSEIGWCLLRSRMRDFECRKKYALAQAGTGEVAARGAEFGARYRTMNQLTNQPMNESTNEPNKRIFGSMFAKVRCALGKPRQFKTLQQLLRFSERPESHKESPNEAPAKRSEAFQISFGARKVKSAAALRSIHEATLAGGGADRND